MFGFSVYKCVVLLGTPTFDRPLGMDWCNLSHSWRSVAGCLPHQLSHSRHLGTRNWPCDIRYRSHHTSFGTGLYSSDGVLKSKRGGNIQMMLPMARWLWAKTRRAKELMWSLSGRFQTVSLNYALFTRRNLWNIKACHECHWSVITESCWITTTS